MAKIYDLIGIGFGPSNLALAIALEEMGASGSHLFLERAPKAAWQDGMLLDGSDIQNNPLRDLVTPRNPRSRYSFVNYLFEVGRLFDYLNLGLHYPLRKDYARYICWVADHFSSAVHYNTEVASVELASDGPGPARVWRLTTADGQEYLTRCLVMGTGRSPRIPAVFAPHLGNQIFHLNHYLPRLEALQLSADSRVAVVGASQSAVEILLDLTARNSTMKIYAIHRAYSFRLKDTSPFSDHVYFPEFIDYFYNVSWESKRHLEGQLRPTNYSSADGDVLHQLYLRLYEEKLDGKQRVELLNNTEVESVERAGPGWLLGTREIHTGDLRHIEVDAVVLATGFLDLGPDSQRFPPLLTDVRGALTIDNQGVIQVMRDYSVPLQGACAMPLLYLNGLCESTHGLGDAGSFSLVSLRSAEIARSVLKGLERIG